MKDVVGGWWHGHDVAAAVAMLDRDFGPLGAAPVSEAELRAAMTGVADEGDDDLRRHQIGWMARRANAALAVAGREERVRAFAVDDEHDDDGWYLVTPGEYEIELSRRGPPDDLEKQWDDPSVLDPRAIPSAPAPTSALGRWPLVIRTWWAHDDYATAVHALNEGFAPFGVPPTSERELRDTIYLERKDKPQLRRFQIGWLARRANALLARTGRTERLRAFGGGDSPETGWRLIAARELRAAREELGEPENIERVFDDANIEDPIGVLRITPAPNAKGFAADHVAAEAIRKHDYTLAARMAKRLVDRGDEFLHVLMLMECLVRIGQVEVARPYWPTTAQRWLAGFSYAIYQHQWTRLLGLHPKLRLPEDELFAKACAARDHAPR